jgi:excisionase family DNA binding protein
MERPLTTSVSEAAHVLGISRSLAYRAVRAGEIPSIRIGDRVLVPRKLLEQMVGDGWSPQEDR